MAPKRDAETAFGKSLGHVSAFAAARSRKAAEQIIAISPAQLVEVHEELPVNSEGILHLPVIEHRDFDLIANAEVADSDPFEDSDLELNEPPEQPSIPESTGPLSLFKPSNIIREDGSATEIILEENEYITVLGNYRLEVKQGAIRVYGSVITPQSGVVKIYAPSTHALPTIRALRNQQKVHICISSFKSGLHKLERLSPLFRNLWTENFAHRCETIQTWRIITHSDEASRSLHALEDNEATQNVLQYLSTKSGEHQRLPRILTGGIKSAGKSTFNRILCNHLLSSTKVKRIVYLDLDPGQPEFGLPGQLSLVHVSAPILGPPFSHLASTTDPSYRLIRSHTIATVTPNRDEDHLMLCISDLGNFIHPTQDIVVVNWCGWATPTGSKVFCDLAKLLQIDEVVILGDMREVCALLDQSGKPYHKLEKRRWQPLRRTPREKRDMQTIAYMHRIEREQGNGHLQWTGKTLPEIPPFTIKYNGSNADISSFIFYTALPAPQWLTEATDGMMVAIVVSDSQKPFSDTTEEENTHSNDSSLFLPIPNTTAFTQLGQPTVSLANFKRRSPGGIPYFQTPFAGVAKLNPATTHCVGYALVQGINHKDGTINLQAPLTRADEEALARAQAAFLVRGLWDAPEWAYRETGFARTHDEAAGLLSDEHRGDKCEQPWLSHEPRVGLEAAVWRERHAPAPVPRR